MAEFKPAGIVGQLAERDELLATKIVVPPVRPELLARPRLIDLLGRGFVLVCAPAGFGKTTMLSDWAAHAAWPVAWLSLDSDDNEPVRFWRYVVAALDRASPGLASRVIPLLGDPNGGWRQGVTGLLNALGALTDKLVLVLDDYHVLDSAAIHDSLAYALDRAPPQLHVVIATRSDPPLPAARLRASGRLTELRADELRFTEDEAAGFMRDIWDLRLSKDAVAALEARTEGWAAGLQLAALSLRGRSDPDAFVDAFTGSHRFVLDYLSEEVLGRQPDEVRTFLLQTSVLERLTGPVCDAVTGRSDGQEMLEALDRANLFVVPLDQTRRWYRYHRLFSDLLRARLQQSDPELVPELHRRAAVWSKRHGFVEDAIGHALASGEADRATALVDAHVGETLRRGESVILERWLSALPEPVVRSDPRLCLARAMMAFHRYQLDVVERLLDYAEHAFDMSAAPDAGEIPTEGGMVAAVPAAIALPRDRQAGRIGVVEHAQNYPLRERHARK